METAEILFFSARLLGSFVFVGAFRSVTRMLRLPKLASRGSSSVLPLLRSRYSTAAAGSIGELDLQHFASIVGPTNVVTEAADLENYNTDWMRKYVGHSKVALRPGSTEEVSKILAHCNEQRIPVVPQGGNTGLVGGSVPIKDELVLSLNRMNQVRRSVLSGAARGRRSPTQSSEWPRPRPQSMAHVHTHARFTHGPRRLHIPFSRE